MGSLHKSEIVVKNSLGCNLYFLWLIFCLFTNVLHAQSNLSQKPEFLSYGVYYGIFQVHTDKLLYYDGVKVKGMELEYSRWLLTEKAKMSFGFYPKWGVGFNYVDFGHKSLGYSVNGIAYIEPFFKSKGKLRLSGKLGAGLAYLSNPYDKIGNSLNLTNSTKVAFPLIGGFNIYYSLNDWLALKASASYRHISNGGIRQPNFGINYPLIGLAMEYSSNRYGIPEFTKVSSINNNNRTTVLVAYSLKTDMNTDVNSNVMLMCFNRCFGGSRLNAFSYSAMVEYQQINGKASISEQWSMRPLVGNEFLIGKLRFGQQIGAYFLQGKNAPNNLFQNYYIRYLYKSKFIIGANLKTHGRVADYLAFQIGLVL